MSLHLCSSVFIGGSNSVRGTRREAVLQHSRLPMQQEQPDRPRADGDRLLENRQRPSACADPFAKQITGLPSRLAEQHRPVLGQMRPPEWLQMLPLSALVQYVRAQDQIELLIETVRLPV